MKLPRFLFASPTRRDVLFGSGMGLGSIALSALLG